MQSLWWHSLFSVKLLPCISLDSVSLEENNNPFNRQITCEIALKTDSTRGACNAAGTKSSTWSRCNVQTLFTGYRFNNLTAQKEPAHVFGSGEIHTCPGASWTYRDGRRKATKSQKQLEFHEVSEHMFRGQIQLFTQIWDSNKISFEKSVLKTQTCYLCLHLCMNVHTLIFSSFSFSFRLKLGDLILTKLCPCSVLSFNKKKRRIF